MPAFAEWIATGPDIAMTGGGLLIGMFFGAIVHRANYCTMGAISDWWTSGNFQRLGAVALAAATAIVGAQLLDAYAVTDLSKSIYLSPRINWLGAIVGGLVFGAGIGGLATIEDNYGKYLETKTPKKNTLRNACTRTMD